MNPSKNRIVRKSALLTALAFVALLNAQSANAATTMIYATIDGSRQGLLKGDSLLNDRRDKTEVLKFAYSVNAPSSGRRQHGPVKITKAVGPASPQLFQALVTNELIKSVVIDFLAINASGEEYLATSIRLGNAKVIGIDQFTEDAATTTKGTGSSLRNLETISFTFQTIEINSLDGKTTAMDSLAAP